MSAGAQRSLGHRISMELELQAIFEPPDLGAGNATPVRALCTLIHWIISPALHSHFRSG